jgi:transcriptional regulator with XRE-family HTH domain
LTDDQRLYADVGRRIRAARERCGMTQDALATIVGLSRTSVTNIERGRQKLLLHTLNRVAAALRMQIAELLPVSGAESNHAELDDLLKGRSADESEWIRSVMHANRTRD